MVREDSSKDVMFKLRLNDEQKLGLKNLGGGGELQRGKSKHKDSKGCVFEVRMKVEVLRGGKRWK